MNSQGEDQLGNLPLLISENFLNPEKIHRVKIRKSAVSVGVLAGLSLDRLHIENLTLVVILYEIYETSLRRVS